MRIFVSLSDNFNTISYTMCNIGYYVNDIIMLLWLIKLCDSWGPCATADVHV